jgi:Barstar (barnase inhibitor)
MRRVAADDVRPVLVIDGSRFSDFAGFAVEFSRLLSDYTWRGNLDAFNDILRGGFGTPEGGFTLRWDHSDLSRVRLGHEAMATRFEGLLETCHPSNRSRISEELDAARSGVGPTLFDLIVEIIGYHGPGGVEAEDHVYLDLR